MSWESDLWNPANTLFTELLPKRLDNGYTKAAAQYADQLHREQAQPPRGQRASPGNRQHDRALHDEQGPSLFSEEGD